MPTISLVIPAYNEAELLPRLLDTVDVAREHYRDGSDVIEVIVADNLSTDGTAALAEARGCRVASVEKRCIASARNGGAAIARGKILGFVDADQRIHPETFDTIADALARDDVIAGATGVTLERWSLGIAMTWLTLVPLVWLLGMDTGVVFCRRADFETIGGYDEEREVGEDVAFLWALKRLGRSRGQKLLRARKAKAINSMRKFDQHGDWHFLTRILPQGAIGLLRPATMTALARHFWYVDER